MCTEQTEVEQTKWLRRDNKLCIETSLAFVGTKVCAKIEMDNEKGGKGLAFNVDVNGTLHAFPLSVEANDIHNCYNIDSLFIRAFSPHVFVVFVNLANGAWPVACFTKKPGEDFNSTLMYSKEVVADIAVIDDRYLVLTEVVMCHRRLFVQCYDMRDTAQRCGWPGAANITMITLCCTRTWTQTRTRAWWTCTSSA